MQYFFFFRLHFRARMQNNSIKNNKIYNCLRFTFFLRNPITDKSISLRGKNVESAARFRMQKSSVYNLSWNRLRTRKKKIERCYLIRKLVQRKRTINNGVSNLNNVSFNFIIHAVVRSPQHCDFPCSRVKP